MSTKEYGTDKKSETNFSYLSIGSNIGDRLHNLSKSQIEIEKVIGKIHKSSKIYETEPWGFKEQKFFLNMVIYVETLLNAESLLLACKKIEKNMGRVKNKKWGERNIDIDILYYNNDIINQKIYKYHTSTFMRENLFSNRLMISIQTILIQQYEKLTQNY